MPDADAVTAVDATSRVSTARPGASRASARCSRGNDADLGTIRECSGDARREASGPVQSRAKAAMSRAVSRADVGARDGEDLGTVHRPHHLTAAGGDPGCEQQAVEVDPFVAQRVTLVDVDHCRWEAGHVVHAGERRPRQRVALVERLNPVGHGAAVVVEVQEDALVLHGGRASRRRPLPGDEGAEGIEALDQSQIPVAVELEAGGQGEVPAATLAGDDDPRRIDSQLGGVGGGPAQARHAVVEARRERSNLRRGRCDQAIAKVDHHHRDAVGRDVLPPAPVHPVEAGHLCHAAAVEVVHAGQGFVARA